MTRQSMHYTGVRLSVIISRMGYSMLIVACVCVVALFLSRSVGAQQEIGLQIAPAILDVSARPGQQTETSVTVTNTSAQPIAVSVMMRPVAPTDEALDVASTQRYDVSTWVEPSLSELVLGPGEAQAVSIRVTPPADAVPGGQYGNVVFRVLNQSDEPDGSGVAVYREAAAVLLVTVPGQLEEQVDIETVNTQAWVFGGAVDQEYLVRNTGNVHVAPIITTRFFDRDECRS